MHSGVLLIDNYDSFVYNLRDYILVLGFHVVIKRNDEITIEDVHQMKPQAIVLSPGPCSPNEAGITLQLISTCTNIPMFGVCLGHQAIAQSFGAVVTKAKRPVHGIASTIQHHGNTPIFTGIPSFFKAVRYHSLIVDPLTVPESLNVTAIDTENNIMGISHKNHCIHGVQFHPESICSEHGPKIIKNFLDIAFSTQSTNTATNIHIPA